MKFFGQIKKGKLIFFNREDFNRWIAVQKDMHVTIVIGEQNDKRTVLQNKLWWQAMTILGNHLGYTKEEMHDIAKFKLLKREKVDDNTGEIFEYLESTTKLTKESFAEVYNHLQIWSSQLGCYIGNENEQLKILG